MTVIIYVAYGPPERFLDIDAVIRHEDSEGDPDALHILRHGVRIGVFSPGQVLKVEIVKI